MIADEVSWVGIEKTSADRKNPKAYSQERMWFWTCFLSGGATVRVCWQEFRETPTLDWLLNMAKFAENLEWWKIKPSQETILESNLEAYCGYIPLANGYST